MQIRVPSTLETTDNVSSELKSFSQGCCLKTSLSSMNLNVLQDRYRCCDIYPRVRLDLARKQDRKSSKRLELAEDVANCMAKSLSQTFTGSESNSKLVLRIHITVVSNGNGTIKQRIADVLGRGKDKGKGLSKLTVAYCLYCRETGNIAVSKQLSRDESHCGCSSNNLDTQKRRSKAVLLELEEELRREISKEVKFTCCSRLPDWNQFSCRMLQVETDTTDERNSNIKKHSLLGVEEEDDEDEGFGDTERSSFFEVSSISNN